MTTKIKKTPEQLARDFLNYAFRDIEFVYENLTDTEKALCTRKEFDELVKWIRS